MKNHSGNNQNSQPNSDSGNLATENPFADPQIQQLPGTSNQGGDSSDTATVEENAAVEENATVKENATVEVNSEQATVAVPGKSALQNLNSDLMEALGFNPLYLLGLRPKLNPHAIRTLRSPKPIW